MPGLDNDQQADRKCKHITLDIGMFNSIFLLHIKNIKLSSQILQCTSLNSIL